MMETNSITLARGKREREEVTPKTIASLRHKLGLSQERMGRLAGVSTRTVARWENGDVEPEPLFKKRLAGLGAVVRALEDVGDPADVVDWLETPDPRFHNQPPMDLLGSSHATAELLDSIVQWGKGDMS
jgi:transcriptional regulator with XRE-family HTH domain